MVEQTQIINTLIRQYTCTFVYETKVNNGLQFRVSYTHFQMLLFVPDHNDNKWKQDN